MKKKLVQPDLDEAKIVADFLANLIHSNNLTLTLDASYVFDKWEEGCALIDYSNFLINGLVVPQLVGSYLVESMQELAESK
jgi:hypothetical protein